MSRFCRTRHATAIGDLRPVAIDLAKATTDDKTHQPSLVAPTNTYESRAMVATTRTLDRCMCVYTSSALTLGPDGMSDLASVATNNRQFVHNLELRARHMTYARAIDAHGAWRPTMRPTSGGPSCLFEALRIEAGPGAHEVSEVVLRGMVSYAFTAY